MQTQSTRQIWRAHLVAFWLCGVTLALLATASCKHNKKSTEKEQGGVDDMTIVVEQDKSHLSEQEAALAEKAKAVEAEKQRIAQEKADLEAQLSTLSKKDRKKKQQIEQHEALLAAQEAKLSEKTRTIDTEHEKLLQEKTHLLERIGKMAQNQGSLTVTQREEAMASREQRLAEREKQVAEREKAVAVRESEVGTRLDEAQRVLTGLQSASTLVRTAAPSAGSSAGAKEASRQSTTKLQQKVRAKMDAKGVLADDLPPGERDLEGSGKQAIEAKDYAAATDALTRLEGVVDSIDVNQAFVQAKMTRINKMYQGKMDSLDEGRRKRVLGLLEEVSDSFSDGRYDRANKKINQIYNVLLGN